MIYVDQSADNLRLSVVQGPIDLSQLHVISTTTLTLNATEYILLMGIIGASHYIMLVTNEGEVVLTEVLACLSLEAENTLLDSVRDVRALSLNVGNVHYAFTSDKYMWCTGKHKFEQLVNLTKCTNNTSASLSYVFPTNKKTLFKPTTIVTAVVSGHLITIKTVHAYPNEDALVFTRTILTIN